MSLPRIDAGEERIGFVWRTAAGAPVKLAELLTAPEAEPDRWLPTHLAALDDILIEIAGRLGEVIGGGRGFGPGEREVAVAAYREIDRLCHEYAQAHRLAGLPDDKRAGQIIGTGALMSIRLRESLGLMGPAPFDGFLDEPGPGVVGGRAGLAWVAASERWRGARWLVTTLDGKRLPATLSMLLFDSSGMEKEGTLTEHRDALGELTDAVTGLDAEPMAASGAVDWLLFDWVMAHRDGPDSGAVEIKSGLIADARMIVLAAEASATVRARFDIGLLDLPI